MNITRSTRPWHPMLWATIAALLLAPLIAMRFTPEVAWTASDFAIAAGLLVGAGALFEGASRLTFDRNRRRVIGGALLLAVLTVWADGAVGIF